MAIFRTIQNTINTPTYSSKKNQPLPLQCGTPFNLLRRAL